MIKIQVDGEFYEVRPGNNLLHTLLALGFDIPYFCFHPAMGSVGACRQCAVKRFRDQEDKTGKIIMSCMEPVSEGMIISTNDDSVKAFRAAIIEALMTNHPHDCPVCDEGGECHLQDMTVMTGHDYRRFSFRKRTYRNQDLGPFIHQEMNRCIQCYRCLRFYTEYAGGTDFGVFGSANRVFFGRHSDGTLQSEFSGNLVEVCPTGVFTDKTFRQHFTRKWDLTNAPSICIHCSLGCNIIISERYGKVRRVMSRYNPDLNGYFICDRGRFGYEFLNNPARITRPGLKSSHDRDHADASEEKVLRLLRTAFKGHKLTGIGSPRASLESNYALEKLVGRENFYHGVSDTEYRLTGKAIQILTSGIAHTPSLKEIEKADAVLVLGEDPVNTAPMLALAIRQAVASNSARIAERSGIPEWNDAAVRISGQKLRTPLFIASPFRTKLDEIAELTVRSAPADIARLVSEISAAIDNYSEKNINQIHKIEGTIQKIAGALLQAEKPVIITGLHYSEESLLDMAYSLAVSLSAKGKNTSLSIIFPESNSVGLGLMEGKSLSELSANISESDRNTLIIVENDLLERIPENRAEILLKTFDKVVVLDHIPTRTTLLADILIPSAPFAESTGTIVNNEGRAQRFYRVLPANETVGEAWRILTDPDLSEKSRTNKKPVFDDIVNSLTKEYPIFYKVKEEVPDSGTRFLNEKIARQTPRYSGRTSIHASIDVSEQKPAEDNDAPLAFSMEGYKGIPPSSYLIPYYWSPGWNSVQATNRYMDEPDGRLAGGTPGVNLFDNATGKGKRFSHEIPGQFRSNPEKTFLLPVWLIFGSEELSSAAKSLSQLIPETFILINDKEIKKYIDIENKVAKVTVNNTVIEVKVIIDNSVPDGIAGISLLAGSTMNRGVLPDWGVIEKSDTQ